MKLRIRSTAKKETIRVEAPDASSLFDLKTLIASKLSSSFAPILPVAVRLSLNGADEIIASSPGESLTALGLISGDLLFYSLNSGFCSTPSNLASTPAVVAFMDPSSESLPKEPADDLVLKVEAGKVKINGNMGLTVVASSLGFGVSSQKRAKPSPHGEANSIKPVWKKAKAVSFGRASVCHPSVSPAKSSSSQGKATPLVTPCDKQSSDGKDAAGGTPPSLLTPGILWDDLPAAGKARSKELPPSRPFGRWRYDHVVNPAKSSLKGKSTSSASRRDNGPLQSSKGIDATGGTPPSSRTPGILSDDLPAAGKARSKELPPSPPFGGWRYDHVAAISVNPAKSSLKGKSTSSATRRGNGPLQSSKGIDATGGTPPSSRTPGILSRDLSTASEAGSKELPPSPPFGRWSYDDHVAAISVSPTRSSQTSNEKDAVAGTPPSSRTPGILSDDLSAASEARSMELPPPPSFGRWSYDHIASISVNPAKFSSQGKESPSVTPLVKLPLQSSAGGTPPDSHTPGILSDDLPSASEMASEARSKEVPLSPFGRWPYDHVAAISAPINGRTAIGDLQSRLAAYVADMEARMRVVELSNLSSRVTAMEARVALVEGYEPRLRAAEERYSEIADMRVQISGIRRQVDHLVVDFTRVTHSVGTSSEQALVLELVRQGKQHLAQAEALFQTATTFLAYNTHHAPNP